LQKRGRIKTLPLFGLLKPREGHEAFTWFLLPPSLPEHPESLELSQGLALLLQAHQPELLALPALERGEEGVALPSFRSRRRLAYR